MANLRIPALLISALLFCARADAQVLGLSATASPNPVTVSNTVTYTIDVTNRGATQQNILVTNEFSLPVLSTVRASTNSDIGGYYTNSVTIIPTGVVFGFNSVISGDIVEMTLIVTPTETGSLTNFISVASSLGTGTTISYASNNVVTEVIANTNINTPSTADLGVTISGFPKDIYLNDRVTYEISVTNAGPDSASNVALSNSIPSSVKFLSISPANQNYTLASNSVVLDLGTLTNGAAKNFSFTIQLTNTGNLNFSAAVDSDQTDSNDANNSFSTNVTVSDFLAGTSNLVAFINSPQEFKAQSGRLEQIITLSNAGPSQISAARIIVLGLTNWLSNAIGTNDGNPFVVCGAPLSGHKSMNLIFQYYPNTRAFPFDDSQLHPVEVATPDFSLPAPAQTSTNLNIILAAKLPPGIVLADNATIIEFPTETNRVYTIAYKDDLNSTNWLAAQPSFKTSANYVLWIDYGPPETLSNSPTRYYRVYMNPQTP